MTSIISFATRRLVTALGLSLAGCATGGAPADGVTILNPELAAAYRDQAATMAAPRAPLRVAGATLTSCAEYLEYDAPIDTEAILHNRIALQEYVVCDSLALLQDARPAPDTAAGAGQALGTRLDFRTFHSSLRQRTSAEAFTLQALAGEPLAIGPHVAELDSDEWYLKLELVAVADIDANGKADWLVWVVDQSKVGSYLAFKPLVVYNATDTELLTGSPLR